MKNKIAFLLVAVLSVPTLAYAGDRHNRGYNSYNRGYNHNYNHGYRHNYNHNRNNNWVAPAVGALILGGVIGASINNQQRYATPVYVVPQPSYRYENVYVPSCACYQTVLVSN